MRRTSTVLAATGLLAIAAAGTLRFAIVPAQAQLPADTDTTRSYTGTINTMLNAQALAAVDLANVIVRDVPVSIERSTVVTGVDGGIATVDEQSVISAPDGSTILASDTTYTVDRRTMEGQGDRQGLVMGWPIGTEARDYQGWSSDLQTTVDLTYTGTQAVDGINAHVFTSSIAGQIVNPEVLASFPSSLPKSALPIVASVLDVPAAVAEALPSLLSVLPDDVTLGYWLTSDTTYLVDPATGMVLDLERSEARQVAFDVEGVPATPLADVFNMDYRGTEASVAATVADSKAAASTLSLFGTTLPLALLVLGAALLATAFVTNRKVDADHVITLEDNKVLAKA